MAGTTEIRDWFEIPAGTGCNATEGEGASLMDMGTNVEIGSGGSTELPSWANTKSSFGAETGLKEGLTVMGAATAFPFLPTVSHSPSWETWAEEIEPFKPARGAEEEAPRRLLGISLEEGAGGKGVPED